MKAIVVNVKKSSGYSQYNGLTFEVKEILSDIIALRIPSQLIEGRFDTIDFTFSEVVIVDFANELQKAWDNANWDSSAMRTLHNMRKYKEVKGIKNIKLSYNCPA